MRQAPPPASAPDAADATLNMGTQENGAERKMPGGFLRRAVDLGISVPALALAAPIILAAAMAIRLTSPGPALFVQTRVGQHQVAFSCYKLRTMRMGTRQLATHLANPQHVTLVGRFLRRSKLDELPQLWNVIRGDMSLVGPRPCLPNQYELILFREQKGVFSVRPGITGFAQVMHCDMSDPERCAQLDADYIARQTLWGDLVLMIKTLFA